MRSTPNNFAAVARDHLAAGLCDDRLLPAEAAQGCGDGLDRLIVAPGVRGAAEEFGDRDPLDREKRCMLLLQALPLRPEALWAGGLDVRPTWRLGNWARDLLRV